MELAGVLVSPDVLVFRSWMVVSTGRLTTASPARIGTERSIQSRLVLKTMLQKRVSDRNADYPTTSS